MAQHPSSVSDCMHRKPLTILPEASLVEAIETIVENRLTGLTVIDAEGKVRGVVSELDCLRGVLASIYNDGDPERARVEDVMTREVNSCSVTDSIVEVAQSMLDTRQRRRPVMEGDRLVGQVSCRNILWALMEHSRARYFSAQR